MPNEYSDLIDVAQPAARPVNEYSELLNSAPAEARVMAAEDDSPDEAAKVAAAAKRLGLPYPLAKADPRDTLRMDERQARKTTLTRNPFVQDYVENNPAAAAVSKDDWGVLDKFSQAWQALTAPDPIGRLATGMGAGAIGPGVRSGFYGEAQGIARARGRTAEAEELDTYLQSVPQFQEGFARYANMAGALVGQFGYDALVGGPQGASIGAAGGLAVGGPAGAVAGAGVGFLGGVSSTAGIAAYGRNLTDQDKTEKAAGIKIDPVAKHMVAGTVGLLNAGANLIGVKAVGGVAAEVLSEAAVQAVMKPGVAAALTRAGTQVGKGGALGATLMGTLTAADLVLQDAAKAYSAEEFATIFNDPEARRTIVGNVAQAMADGFVLMGAVHAVPAGRNLANDLRLGREAAADKAALQGLIEVRAESATAKRAPDEFADYASRHGDESLTITEEGVAQLPPEVAQGMALRQMPDGSVEVPLAEYVAKVPDEVHARVADDIVHQPDGVSVREVEGLAQLAGGREVEGIARPVGESAIPEAHPVVEATLASQRQMYLEPIFPDAQAMMMGEGEFGRYNKLLEQRAESLRALNEKRAAADAKARQSPEYAAREEAVREEVTANVDNRPDFVAERLARTGLDTDRTRLGDFKLDREVVDAMSRPGTADQMRGLVRKGGIHPDELAELAGYGSGAEMVQDLLSMTVERKRLGLSPDKYREAVIKSQTQERMLERFGDLPENIAREARELAIMPQATEILAAEREALAAQVGGKPAATLDELRSVAAEQFATLGLKEARDLAGYMRAVGRAGRKAELALLKGDYAAAFLAKQQQMQAHLFAEQAKAFDQAQRKLERKLKPYAEQSTVEAASQRYVDQIQGLLARLGVEVRRDSRDLGEVLAKADSLENFIAARNGDLGGLIPDAALPPKQLRDYNVEEMRQFQDLIQALDFQARAEKKLRVGEKQVDLEEAVATAVEAILKLPERYDPGRKGLMALVALGRRKIDAPLLKMEQLFEWFDKHDKNSTFHEAVVKPLHKAQGLRDDLFVEIGKQLSKLGGEKKWNKRLRESVPNNELIDPFNDKPFAFTRKELIGVMLNMGNATNFDVLAKGYGWDQQAIRNFVDKNATKADWEFVQGIWNVFKSLEEPIKQTYRELAGVGPEMIQPNKVFTKFGTAEGGYYPLIKDPLRNDIGDGMEQPLFQRGQVQPLPANGYAKSRTGATYPLDLGLDNIAAQLRVTAHDLAFRGPVIEAQKFLMHPSIQKAVKQTFGPEYASEFFPYLRDIANDGVGDVAGIAFFTRASAALRAQVVNMMIGFNIGTVIIHGGSAGLNSIGELVQSNGFKTAGSAIPSFVSTIGKRTVGSIAEVTWNQTVARWTNNPVNFNKGWQDAMVQSAEMRNRLHNFDRDLMVQQNRALGKKNYSVIFNNWATAWVSYSDLLTAVPTYMAARDIALANGKSLEEAIAIGEKTVRQAHGSSGIVDRARIQRGSEWHKWFTMFFGYFSHNYNRNRNTWRDATEAKQMAIDGKYVEAGNQALKVTSAIMFYALLPAWNHARVRHEQGDQEHFGRWMAKALLTQATGDLPYLRDVFRGVVSGHDAVATPLSVAYESMSRTIQNAMVAAGVSHDKMKPKAFRDAVTTAGLVTGTSGIAAAVGRPGQFILDVKAGRQHPEGFYEWYKGFFYGKAKSEGH